MKNAKSGFNIIVVIAVYILTLYNCFIKINNKVKEHFLLWTSIWKRWDLISNIDEIAKMYVQYEKDTLSEIIKLWSTIYDNMSTDDKILTNEKLFTAINKLMLLVEIILI